MELSGAYHHILPGASPLGPSPGRGRLVRIAQEEVAWAEAQARLWRQSSAGSPVPPEVEAHWAVLFDSQGEDLFVMQHVDDAPPSWWRSAILLLMTADQASVGIGFDLPAGTGDEIPGEVTASWVDSLWRELAPKLESKANGPGLNHSRARGIYSFSSADPNVVCVLPKVRTAGVGCSLRSLTHNLALLPPCGVARVWWLEAPEPPGDHRRPMNIVLLPYPYRISARCFREGVTNREKGWGWFELDQRWLRPHGVDARKARKEISRFVVDLVEAAERDVGDIHGIVMPELALDYPTFEAVAAALTRSPAGRTLEFFVCGTSGNSVREGNFACTFTYARLEDEGQSKVVGLVDDRQKHHRWRLDRYQISRYGLTSRLDPDLLWWEDLPILSRSLSIQQIRGDSVFTSMICEDLARVDPCQEALRSVGPNIVFALLMDGPQLKSRWPGRYATVLAEDPGCSVLTLSSMGLIHRANQSGTDPASDVIALWKDIDTDRREIRMDPGSFAVCITLNSRPSEEFTLDGRSDGKAAALWTLGSVAQVSRASVKTAPDWIATCP